MNINGKFLDGAMVITVFPGKETGKICGEFC